MDKRFICTAIAVGTVVAMAAIFAAFPEQTGGIPMQENVSNVEISPKSAERPGSYAYLLKEYNGRIAVYMADESEPEMILDVLVKHLPDQDRQELTAGIPVRDYNELVSRIEDYTS